MLHNKGMGISSYLLFLAFFITGVFAFHWVYAQEQGLFEDRSAERLEEVLPSPVRSEVIRVLKPEEWLKTLQQYIKAPLPGTDVKDVEVDKEKISELNLQISSETGVDLLKFFQFVGKVLVILLESIARLIRGLLSGG